MFIIFEKINTGRRNKKTNFFLRWREGVQRRQMLRIRFYIELMPYGIRKKTTFPDK